MTWVWSVAAMLALGGLVAAEAWAERRRERRRLAALRVAALQRGLRTVSTAIGVSLIPVMADAVKAFEAFAEATRRLDEALKRGPSW